MEVNKSFWKNKKILLTGHTGFKGAWGIKILKYLGAEIYGFSIDIPTKPSFYELVDCKQDLSGEKFADIIDLKSIDDYILQTRPEIIIHLAAQPLVRKSYENPIETYATNVMGTLNLLNSALSCKQLKVILNITSDKCYLNKESIYRYNEDDSLGGHDPYSSSKACAEILTNSMRDSFYKNSTIKLISARAGNVIGGGDFAEDRLLPDIIRAIEYNNLFKVRNLKSIRPWQSVLELWTGYLNFIEKTYCNEISIPSLNFGPSKRENITVQEILDQCNSFFDRKLKIETEVKDLKHEANLLMLDSAKAQKLIGWNPSESIQEKINETLEWYNAYLKKENLKTLTTKQIRKYIDKK